MIITKLIGGLGNQMFQYAIGRSLAIKNNTELKLDLSGYENQQGIIPRNYSLGIFQIDSKIASKEESFGLKYSSRFMGILGYKKKSYLKEKIANKYDPEIFKVTGNNYLEGYWQTEKYFLMIADVIRKEFSLRIEFNNLDIELLNQIAKCQSVSLHVRRGDYVSNSKTNQFHGSCSLKYYQDSIEYLKNKFGQIVLFIFSDDIEWVKENLQTDQKMVFVSNDKLKDYEELILMSKCKHNIIANSSFSWWGAWLNTNYDKQVIAPKYWFNNAHANINDIVPENWIRI